MPSRLAAVTLRARAAWRLAVGVLLLLLLCAAGFSAPPAAAQSSSDFPSYWQYAAAGRLRQVVPADINHDGVDEFLAADENGKVDLIGTNGSRLWSYTAPEQVLALGAMNVGDPAASELETVVGVRNRLYLLDAQGQEIWNVPLSAVAVPAALLTGDGSDAATAWLEQYNFLPLDIKAYDHDGDSRSEILVLLRSGQLLLYDQDGSQLWRLTQFTTNTINAPAHVSVADVDGDGRDEIILSVFNARRFSQLVLVDNGRIVWEVPISGRAVAVRPVAFEPGAPPHIAVGTSLGHVYVYDAERQRVWFRTLNKPVTSLAVVPQEGGNVLAAGTQVGTVVAFDGQGRRVWSSTLSNNADQRVLDLSASSFLPPADQPALAAVLQSDAVGTTSADVILLGSDGQPFGRLPNVDTLGLTRFTDSNRDEKNELLIIRFATLELLGVGGGNSENVREWEYPLDAAPTAALAADFDDDGAEEVVIGTQDGRILSLSNSGSIRWLHVTGDAVTHLATLAKPGGGGLNIAVVRNALPEDAVVDDTGWIELREARGEKIWEQPVDAPITAFAAADLDGNGRQELVLGTADGRVVVYSTTGELQWEYQITELAAGVQQLLLLDPPGRQPELVAAGSQTLIGVRPEEDGIRTRRIAGFAEGVRQVYAIQQPGSAELSVSLVVLLADGSIRGLNWRGIEMSHQPWPYELAAPPVLSAATSGTTTGAFNTGPTGFLIADAAGTLQRLDVEGNRPVLVWEQPGLGELTALHWRDSNGDGQADLALAGNREGQAWVLAQTEGDEPLPADPLELSSSVFALTALDRDVTQMPDPLAITENGLVQLFREQENRPPLLTNPVATVQQGQHSVAVSVNDVERDEVSVRLDLWAPETEEWISQETQRLPNGQGTLFWPLASPPPSPEGLAYRLVYDDSFHTGVVTPAVGPPVLVAAPLETVWPTIVGVVLLVGLFGGLVSLRQAQTLNARARRFHNRLQQNRAAALLLLEDKYARTNGSPDFLLHLASQARQAGDQIVADLADGLFLLADRPQAGLSIITRTLDEIKHQPGPAWQGLSRWQKSYAAGQTLLDAPSITELSLHYPLLVDLLQVLEAENVWQPVLTVLRPILANLRDSERVDLAEDRLVYLNQAELRLKQAQEQLPDYSSSIERTLVAAVLRRWAGLVSAEIEELRGRAELVVTLKTKRLAPTEQTHVALDITNSGRSPAENIIALLDNDPAYAVHSDPQLIPFLPPGHTREVRFTVEPQVIDRFRVSLSLSYDDRNQRDKRVAFGDMVHLLPPVRDFSPIPNPYMPGTPLRPDSLLFVGRDDLFEFIAENAGYRSYRNVLILVGQRRTGKTSALLRLRDNLPEHLLPVYIDCQSLGVTPGMPALLEEFAWHIADALSRRDIDVDVPPLEAWQEDPTRLFQRAFLPHVKALLPADATILLVFDEFEAFEQLVADGILPSTFFTYLRHLMQHGEQLNFIFVGTRRLEEMSSDYWSVLFNIALYRKIGYLERPAALRLITEPVAPHLVYDDLALDKILRVTAGHPYFLQLVCYTLVKRANGSRAGYVTISDVNAAVAEMLTLGEVHFAYLWQRSTYAEKALLTAVAHLMDRNAPFHPESLLRYLEPYDIHFTPAEVVTALSSLVERDIMGELSEGAQTLYELKLGLVGLWVAQNKSLSKLYASHSNGATKSSQAIGELSAD